MHTKKILAAFLAVVLMALSIPFVGGVAASEEEITPLETELVTTFEDEPVLEGPTVSLETYELTEDKWIVDVYAEDAYEIGIAAYGFELNYDPKLISFCNATSMTDVIGHNFSHGESNGVGRVVGVFCAKNIFPYERTLLCRLEFDIINAQDGAELGISYNYENVLVTAQSGEEMAEMTTFIGLSEIYNGTPVTTEAVTTYEDEPVETELVTTELVTTFEDEQWCEGPTVSLETHELTEDKLIVDLYVEDWNVTGISKYDLTVKHNTYQTNFITADCLYDCNSSLSLTETGEGYNILELIADTDMRFPAEKTALWRIEFEIVNKTYLSPLHINFDEYSYAHSITDIHGHELHREASYNSLETIYNILPTEHTFEIVDGVLISYDGPGGVVTVPDGVTGIGRAAFGTKGQITEIIIPEGVTYIDTGAFNSCRNLTKVTLPETLTTICRDAFWYCTSLETLYIPNSVTIIQDSIFEGCNVTVYCYENSAAHKHAVDNDIKFVLLKPDATPGDATGDNEVNLGDVSLILKYIANWEVSPDLDAADVTGDMQVTLADASLLLKHIAGWDVTLA